jgi:hypothetical protein
MFMGAPADGNTLISSELAEQVQMCRCARSMLVSLSSRTHGTICCHQCAAAR